MSFDRNLFNFINGFREGHAEPLPKTQQLKDRMRTIVLKARQFYGKNSNNPNIKLFYRFIANDYIKIMKEL